MGGSVEVFCDGSATDALLTDPYTSILTGVNVGRAVVVIPVLDEGLVEQSRAGMVTRKGNPASSAAELFAIRTALGLCDALGLDDSVVYSDSASEVDRVGDTRVEWRPRTEMYLPNEFLDRFFTGPHIRRSRKVVRNRRKLQPHQKELNELLTALAAGSS